MRRVLLPLLVLLLLAAAACGDDDDGVEPTAREGAGEPTTLEVTASDFAFEHPATVPAGPVTVNASNNGEQDHVAILQRIKDGKTFDEVKDVLADPDVEAPVDTVFGVAALSPGSSGNSTFVLSAGNYVFICPIPDRADGAPHFTKGMLSPLTVVEGDGGELPEADVTVTGHDFAFAGVPTDLEAGEMTVEFKNEGEQEHELNLVELEGSATVDDVAEFFLAPPGQGGAPPMRQLGGALIGAGVRAPAVTTYRLEAGKRYAFICGVPDFSSEPPTPHVAKGMRSQEFKVE